MEKWLLPVLSGRRRLTSRELRWLFPNYVIYKLASDGSKLLISALRSSSSRLKCTGD